MCLQAWPLRICLRETIAWFLCWCSQHCCLCVWGALARLTTSLSPVFPLLLLVIVHLCTAEEELCSSSEESSSVQIIQPIQQSRTNNTPANQTNNKDGCRQIYRRTPPSSRPHLQQQRRQNHLRLDLHLRPLSLLSLRPNSSSHLLPQHFRCHSEWRADQIDVFFQ